MSGIRKSPPPAQDPKPQNPASDPKAKQSDPFEGRDAYFDRVYLKSIPTLGDFYKHVLEDDFDIVPNNKPNLADTLTLDTGSNDVFVTKQPKTYQYTPEQIHLMKGALIAGKGRITTSQVDVLEKAGIPRSLLEALRDGTIVKGGHADEWNRLANGEKPKEDGSLLPPSGIRIPQELLLFVDGGEITDAEQSVLKASADDRDDISNLKVMDLIPHIPLTVDDLLGNKEPKAVHNPTSFSKARTSKKEPIDK